MLHNFSDHAAVILYCLVLQPGATWLSAQATAAAAFAAAAATHQLPTPCLSHTSSSNSSSSPEASDESAATSAGSAAEQSLPPPQLTVQLLGWTGGPRPMPRQQQQWLEQHNMRLKTLRLLCSGIRSRSSAHAGLELGSVLYSDTFLDVSGFRGLGLRGCWGFVNFSVLGFSVELVPRCPSSTSIMTSAACTALQCCHMIPSYQASTFRKYFAVVCIKTSALSSRYRAGRAS